MRQRSSARDSERKETERVNGRVRGKEEREMETKLGERASCPGATPSRP